MPVVVAVVMLALSTRHAAPPADVPLPIVDAKSLAAVEMADDARAATAARDGLPAEVRALGSAIRDFDSREAKSGDERAMAEARAGIDRVLPEAIAHGAAPLLTLRAFELTAFLRELRAFETSGETSDELAAVAGPFVARMKDAGWIDGNRISMNDHARRAAFKTAWNAVVGVDRMPDFALTLDETRALYMFYLSHPHVGERDRQAIDLARKNAASEAACAAVRARETRAVESWTLDKVDRLGKIDPAYPLAYARGVVHYRMGSWEAARRDFDFWLDRHPEGPWTLRARNQLAGTAVLADR